MRITLRRDLFADYLDHAKFRPLNDICRRDHQNVECRRSSRVDSLPGVDVPVYLQVVSSPLRCRFTFCNKLPVGILCG